MLPKLKNWANIAFLKYAYQASQREKPLSDLKYIFSAMVANSLSNAVLGKALQLGKVFDDEQHCPGIEGWGKMKAWAMDTDEGKALLASPKVRDSALLLITHKGRSLRRELRNCGERGKNFRWNVETYI